MLSLRTFGLLLTGLYSCGSWTSSTAHRTNITTFTPSASSTAATDTSSSDSSFLCARSLGGRKWRVTPEKKGLGGSTRWIANAIVIHVPTD